MGKKKTHAEYVDELAKVNPDIEVLGIYCGANIKIPHRCKKDGCVWDATPGHILHGTGCPLCGGTLKKTHKQYVKELFEINSNIEVIGQYVDAKTKITHHCLIHDFYFESTPCNLLNRKNGCLQCSNEKRRDSMKMSQEEYIQRVKEISPYIDVIGKYVNMKTKTIHRCNIHDIEWDALPERVLEGFGCKECGKEKYHQSRAKTTEEYIEDVKTINPDIEVLGEYISNRTPILHRCKIHDKKWNAMPNGILRGQGCYLCRNEKISAKAYKTHEEYVNDLANVNKDIVVIDQYIDCYTPILHRCLIDGNEWYARPVTMLQGGGCPVCSESKGERRIRLWLEKNNIEYIYQYKYEDCKDINILPFDFYLPTYNILIEYDGEQHFRPIEYFGGQEKFELQQKHDTIKNEYCKNNGIPLLRIPYFKYDNIEEELNNFLFI